MSLHLKRTNELKSCIGLIEDENSYSDDEYHQNYCNQKLRLFKNNNFSLTVRIIGNEKVNDVADKSIRKTKSSSTGCRSTRSARPTPSTRDITTSKTCTTLSPHKKPSTTSRSSQVPAAHPGKTFFNRFASKNIELRTEKFSKMLQAICKQYTQFDDVDFLRWLKIDENLILQHSPPRKDKKKAGSGSFSAISSFMDSEKTNELRNLLLELEAGSDANFCLKQMEKFVFENKSPFSRQGVSKPRLTQAGSCSATRRPRASSTSASPYTIRSTSSAHWRSNH